MPDSLLIVEPAEGGVTPSPALGSAMQLVFIPNIKQMMMFQKTLKQVVSALHLLNIQTKYMTNSSMRRFIYDMKEMMTDYLYRRNFARYVGTDVQIVDCGNRLHQVGLGKDCIDCKGTGKYKSNDMYVYFFVIEEMHFIWHQPRENAILAPKISEGTRPAIDKPNYLDIGNNSTEDLMFIVWRFLLQNNYKLSLISKIAYKDFSSKIKSDKRYTGGAE